MLNRAETLEQLARLCRRESTVPPAIQSTGYAELDTVLPHGGWQSGTIVELMPTQIGAGEFQLLMPALARITACEHHIAFISPPYIPFAPALDQRGVRLERLLIMRAEKNADALWTFEQTLRCKSFGAVVAWPDAIKDRDVRRLQLAAEAGHSTGFLYRSPAAALEASPAAMRLRLHPETNGDLCVDILKCRGIRNGLRVRISAHSATRPKSVSNPIAGCASDQSIVVGQ
jgi:hypothetical protein